MECRGVPSARRMHIIHDYAFFSLTEPKNANYFNYLHYLADNQIIKR